MKNILKSSLTYELMSLGLKYYSLNYTASSHRFIYSRNDLSAQNFRLNLKQLKYFNIFIMHDLWCHWNLIGISIGCSAVFPVDNWVLDSLNEITTCYEFKSLTISSNAPSSSISHLNLIPGIWIFHEHIKQFRYVTLKLNVAAIKVRRNLKKLITI